MIFGSPELKIAKTQREMATDDELCEYRVLIRNQGSKEATSVGVSFELNGVYVPDGDDGEYRFAIEIDAPWADVPERKRVIEKKETVPALLFGCRPADDYPAVCFPTEDRDDDPPIERYYVVDGNVERFDQVDTVPLPAFATIEWEVADVTVAAENDGGETKTLDIKVPSPNSAGVDGIDVEIVRDDDDNDTLPSYTVP